MKINGHEMATLVVPAQKNTRLFNAIEAYLTDFDCVDSQDHIGVAWAYDFVGRGRWIGTSHSPGVSLRKATGRPTDYRGQPFLLSVPVWALSEKGKQAAAEYAAS